MDVVQAEHMDKENKENKETIQNKLITIEKIIKLSSVKYNSLYLFFFICNLLMNGIFIYLMYFNDHLLIEEEIKMKYEKKYQEWIELQTIKNNEINLMNEIQMKKNEINLINEMNTQMKNNELKIINNNDKNMMNEIQFGHAAIMNEIQFGHSAIIEKLNHKVSCIGICW